MSTNFTVTALNNPERFQDKVSKGDAVTYEFDFTPWEEDNHTITNVTWTLESGTAAISGQNLTDGVATALLTFNDTGKSIVSVLATTATEKKKVWLEVLAKDQSLCVDDYGYEP